MKRDEYRRMYEAEERQWWYAGMRSISAALLERPLRGLGPRPRLLDAGCGTGQNVALFSRTARAVGVDLSADALEFCRERGAPAARASVLALPFADGTFDVVTSFDVLYHRWITDDREALGELVRVLRPGGLVLVRVPALRILWGAHDEEVLSRHRYTKRELRALVQAAGLEVVALTYANTLLFPLLLARRVLDRVLGRSGSDVGFLPPPLERAFRALLEVESRAVRRLSLPVGASVFAVGRRPAGTIPG